MDLQTQLTDYLQAMVAIESINPAIEAGGTGEAGMAAWLADTCRAIGLEVETYDAAPNRPNVIATWRGNGSGKSILLTGHTDVVGVQNMSIPPFAPTIKDGKLYGRGAFDMKGGLASMLGTVLALQAEGYQPAGDVILGFVADEEFTSLGTEAMLKHVHADAAILTEPSGLKIGIAHRGFVALTVTTHGHAAHGSLYDEGRDAIRYMGRVLDVLDRLESDVLPRNTHPVLGRSSVHAGLIDGGSGYSTYPDRCTLTFEHRTLPNETGEGTLELWQKALDHLHEKDPQFEADVKMLFWRPAFEVAPDAPIVQTLGTVYQQVMGSAPTQRAMFGWLDSALIAAAGIPTVIIGPDGAGAHAAVEYVDLASVADCARIMAACVRLWQA